MSKKALLEKSIRGGGVAVLRFNNPRKLNAWSAPMMTQLSEALGAARGDDEIKAVVVTGTGKYYSAGVDLAAIIKPMAPRKLVDKITVLNERLFDQFLDFPKPIFAAVNGPWYVLFVPSCSR